MKNSPFGTDMQLPVKLKAMGFFSVSMMMLAMLLILAQVFLFHEQNKVFKTTAYCIAAVGSGLLFLFVILTGAYIVKPLLNRK